jgi:hypothetical protein
MKLATISLMAIGIAAVASPCSKLGVRVNQGGLMGDANKLSAIASKKKECEKLREQQVAFEEERSLGGAVALAWMQKADGLLIDPPKGLDLPTAKANQAAVKPPKSDKNALNLYLNHVGKNLAALSSRPGLPWTFGVLESPGVNAYSAPGGYVLVTRGLLELVENEAQLAGVLSHEIAHVTERHALKVYSGVKSNLCGKSVAGELLGAVVDFDSILKTPGGYLDLDKMAGEAVAKFTDQVVEDLTTSGFAEGDEYHADRIAMELSVSAGYSPDEFPRLISKIPEGGGVFAHHPKNADRKAAIQRWFNGIAPASDGSFSPWADWPFKGYKPVANAPEMKLVKKTM